MSISDRLHILYEIIRVSGLKDIMEEDIDNDLYGTSEEYRKIYNYEHTTESEEPRLYEFRNFSVNKKFNNKKFILSVVKLTSIYALKYFRTVLTIDFNNNEDRIFVKELLKKNPIALYNLPIKKLFVIMK
jgi:hypothetical protein